MDGQSRPCRPEIFIALHPGTTDGRRRLAATREYVACVRITIHVRVINESEDVTMSVAQNNNKTTGIIY